MASCAVQVQEQLRAIVGEPEMLVQINEALNDAPCHLPGVAAAHPHLLQAVNAHLHAEAWQHAAQQRRVATRLAATTAVTTSKTFRPRQVQQQVEQTVEDILGYRFRDEALLRSCLIHSCAPSRAGDGAPSPSPPPPQTTSCSPPTCWSATARKKCKM